MEIKLVLYKDEVNSACRLIQKFWKEHNNYNQPMEEAYENLNDWTKEGHKLYFIQFENKEIGLVHLASRGCEIDWLEDIFVLPEFQGRGIGTCVIGLVENLVKEYSDSLYIEAAARNIKAIRLYQKIGYNCLNTITVRKDFHPEKNEVVVKEKLFDLDFEVRKYKHQ